MISSEKKRTPFIYDTPIENLFLVEYMPEAPGEYVKVYLLLAMNASLSKDANSRDMANLLKMDEEDVNRAITYWQNSGLVIEDAGTLTLVNLKEQLFGMAGASKSGKPALGHVLENKDIIAMYDRIQEIVGRSLNSEETKKINYLLSSYNATIEVVISAYEYAKSTGKIYNNYIAKLIRDWTDRGFTTAREVKEYIKEIDRHTAIQNRVQKALGLSTLTEDAREKIDEWVDGMGFSLDEILSACAKASGISNPNVNYVNRTLESIYEEKTGKPYKSKVNTNKEKAKKEDPRYVHQRTRMYYDYLAEVARKKRDEYVRKLEEEHPELKDMESKLLQMSIDRASVAISPNRNKQKLLEEIDEKIKDIEKKRNSYLHRSDIPIDYRNPKYRCGICKDTGTREDGSRCSCYEKRVVQAKEWKG